MTWLTVAQVAELVQLDETTVRRAIRRGDLQASKPCGQIRIDPDAVTAWLEQARVQPARDVPRAPTRRAPRTPQRQPRQTGSFRDKVRKAA